LFDIVIVDIFMGDDSYGFVVKLNDSHYKLVFKFNHLFFDGGSFLVLKEQIDEARKETPLDIEDKTKKIDYYDYSTFLSNLKYEKIDLENCLSLSGFLQSLETVRKSSVSGEMRDDLFEIDLSILNGGSKNIYNEILLFSYAKLIGTLWEIDNVPIISYSYGRNCKDGKFDRIIGTFLDFIPLLLDVNGNKGSNFKYLLEDLLDYREYIKNTNLNFSNFIAKK
jgi:hypothetical protein